jgi:YegS/Rv2252/BmrU family lipid kinase
MTDNLRTYFVVNPHAANGRTGKIWPEFKGLTASVLGEFGFGLTDGPRHAIELTRAAIRSGYEMIVAVGGDGTNNEVVNGFFADDAPVNPEAVFGVICSGTGSDLIKTLDIPRDFREAAPLLAGRDAKPTDVGKMVLRDHQSRDVTRYFINIASFGVGGEVDDRVNRTSKALGGRISFLWASLRGTLAYKNKAVSISLDGGAPLDRRIFNVAVANGRFFGAGMQTAPRATVDDGLFDVVVLGDLSFAEQLKLSRLIYRGEHLSMAKVESYRARTVSATSNDRVLLDVDGEQPGMLPARFELLPGALRVKRR